MNETADEVVLSAVRAQVRIVRQEDGFPLIEAEHQIDAFYGLGWMHGEDRQLQMWLLKTIAMGRSSEWLRPEPELIELDRQMRWLDLYSDVASEYARLSAETKAFLDAYCRGVNESVKKHGPVFELRLLRHPRPPWEPRDILALPKLIAYLGLTETQGDGERFIIHLLREGLDPALLKELFPAIKEKISPEYVQLLRSLRGFTPPGGLPSLGGAFALTGSNGWAVGPSRSASGAAVVCGDPHLLLSLPSIWYSAQLRFGSRYFMGATVAGSPIPVFGRTADISWTVTYGAADTVDFFIEEIRQGRYRRGNRWVPLKHRDELLVPRGSQAQHLHFYETDCGLLLGDPTEDGNYLCFNWTGRRNVSAETIESFLRLYHAQTARQAQKCFAAMPFAAFNWTFGDRQGDIGYQMSGLIPRRHRGHSGLLPVIPEKGPWAGMLSSEQMPQAFNPAEGFLVTANNDLSHLAKGDCFTLPMSSYRSNRIGRLLKQNRSISIEDMQKIQYDRTSPQAEAFMKILRPLLPDTEQGRTLANWDCTYSPDSVGATLFESVYRELILLVFGETGMSHIHNEEGSDAAAARGRTLMIQAMDGSFLFGMLHGNFDHVLLKKKSPWFGMHTREDLYATAIERGLETEGRGFGDAFAVTIPHILFGGRLPFFLGFDYGPIPMQGSRGTISQGQAFQWMGRPAAAGPTYHFIADMKSDEAWVNLPGGPSDRRFSPLFLSGMKGYLAGVYTRYTAGTSH